MRFFKSFPGFLHRRSRSDSSIPKPNPAWDHIFLNRPQSLDASEAALLADAHVPACPRAYVSHADSRNALFELEATNRLLKTDLCTWSNKYYDLKSQLETTRSDLFSTLHQNSVLERESHLQRSDLRALQEKLLHHERYLELIINVGLHQRVLGDAYAVVRAGIDPDQALVDAIKQAAADPGSAWSSIVPRVAGSRTPDEYKSSLSLTLKTRRDLRDARKIAKFWKQVAAEAGKSDIVTPSPSNVSSIHDTLPPQRQRAVEELISKRRASMALHPANENDIVGAPDIVSVLSLPETAHSSDLGYELPCLSPLASESFRTEIAGFSSNQRLFKRTVFQSRGRSVLALLDQNVKNTSVSINRKKPIAKRGQRAENSPMTIQNNHTGARQDLGVPCNVVPSFSKHSLCSNHLGPLGRIEEEHEDGVDSEDWCILDVSNSDGDPCSLDNSPPAKRAISAFSSHRASRLPKPVASSDRAKKVSIARKKRQDEVSPTSPARRLPWRT